MTTPEYVAARRVLLDALTALHDHLDNLILVGSQAVYLHAGTGTLSVPPMTTDGDLALNTQQLAAEPEIAQTLVDGGFAPGRNPGQWMGNGGIEIDIMVVPHQAGRTSASARGARIPNHGKNVGRITPGLEPALVDNAVHLISSFESHDHRSVDLRVANPAALIVAKAMKIAERQADATRQPSRIVDKDALDMFRLLQEIDTDVLTQGFLCHQAHPDAAVVSLRAIEFLGKEGASSSGRLPQLATRAAFGDPTVGPAFAALTRSLIEAFQSADQPIP